MANVPVRKLNESGIEQFSDFILDGGTGDPPGELLTDPSASDDIGFATLADVSRVFADRVDFAEYAWRLIEPHWQDSLRRDRGFWSWWALAYFSQFRGNKIRRIEHYIFDPSYRLYYRHCAASAVLLVKDYGVEDARLFLSSDMHIYGDMAEQCLRRQYLMRSGKFRKVVRKLYFDERNSRLKKGVISIPPGKKDRHGKLSETGKGGIRRLALEFQRLYLTYNLEEMSAEQIIGLLGPEYDRFK